ncbi:hypothetical protein AMAG_08105 [Allomyces macrogynus ATCC 38327]|uniref:Metallo-beta-lactamase domain-containing protein n=1 Tax=Allomyces macrogynus (strain ATCC 38327) TaxID=578462 RepID=A0A0L0SKJ1_ALLM3|nr:hypothetical protein AMAG_08105 [Allomyces macrogynus ATCC 38327]|eukprot:KNE62929.1 hypothetical protein AMAG_08105 [Allomyces macrogynus ATCC 38327]
MSTPLAFGPLQYDSPVADPPVLYACTVHWHVSRFAAPVPCRTFLVRHGSARWSLIDAGCPGCEAALVDAVQSAIGSDGELAYIFLTHGHLDHTAATNDLLARFPTAKVVAHAREVPYLTGELRYSRTRGSGLLYNITKYLMFESTVRVSRDRIVAVRGDGDEATESTAENVLPCDELQAETGICVLATPGHTPGHAAYLHVPSRAVFTGDAFMNLVPMFGRSPAITAPLALSTVSPSSARASIRSLLKRHDWTRAFPAHDAGAITTQGGDMGCGGVSKDALAVAFPG